MTGKALSSGTGRRRITNAHTKAVAAKAPKRSNGNTAAVQKYLEDNPGGHVWASDIMKETGLTKGQVQQSISYLRSTGGMTNIIIIRPGNAWRYVPKGTMAPAQAPEPEWRPEDNGPVVALETATAPAAVVAAQVHAALPDGSLVVSLGEKQYYAKPLS